MNNHSETDIIISYPRAGKRQKDQLRKSARQSLLDTHHTQQPADIPANFILRQPEPWLQIFSEAEITETTQTDILKLTEYFTMIGRQEGIFSPKRQPEFLIVFHPDKGTGGGKLYTKENLIEIYLPPYRLSQPIERVNFLLRAFHELRHRVNKKILFLEINEEGERVNEYYEHPLDKATYTLHLGKTLEELSTVGFVADNFVSFLEEYLPDLLPVYQQFEATAQETQQGIPATVAESGYGTEVHIDQNSDQDSLFLSALEIYIQIYRQMKSHIPFFERLISEARANQYRAVSHLLQAIKEHYGESILKQLLNYSGPYNQQGYDEGYRLLIDMLQQE